MTKNFI